MNYSSEIIRQKWSIDFNLNYKFVYSLFFNNKPFRIFNHFNMDTLKSWIGYMSSLNNFQFMYFMFVSVEIRFPCILFWTTLSFIFFFRRLVFVYLSVLFKFVLWTFLIYSHAKLCSNLNWTNEKKDHFVVWFILFFCYRAKKVHGINIAGIEQRCFKRDKPDKI